MFSVAYRKRMISERMIVLNGVGLVEARLVISIHRLGEVLPGMEGMLDVDSAGDMGRAICDEHLSTRTYICALGNLNVPSSASDRASSIPSSSEHGNDNVVIIQQATCSS